MTQRRIFIIDDPTTGTVSTQIRTILRQERGYQLEDPMSKIAEGEPDPDLIIVVLPPSREGAEQLLSGLEMPSSLSQLLIVVGPEQLVQLAALLPATGDLLVTPVRKIELLARIQRLLSHAKRQERARVKKSITDTGGLSTLIGEAPAFAAVKLRIHQIAECDLPVLITGETGTGKELCARALHYLSRRATKPFLPVNCAAIPLDLFESELFGREKGAFTGASSSQRGLVAEAEGGTLFLDEIETLSLSAQAKLLRFLSDHTYHVLGSSRPRQSDVRILAATNVLLPRKVQERSFREDLYYRLAVLTLTLPPLRERLADIPLLVADFLTRHASQPGERKQLSESALAALGRYGWPGNIRELENVIQEVIVLTQARIVEAADLRIRVPSSSKETGAGSMKRAKARALDEFEKSYVTEMLRTHGGNVTQAAHEAQKERRSFGRLVKKHHLPKR
jgi:two-component system, NtrC family, response regulator GlrR